MKKQLQMLARQLAAYPKPSTPDGSVSDEEYRAAQWILVNLTSLTALNMKRVEIVDAESEEKRQEAIAQVLAEQREEFSAEAGIGADALETVCKHIIARFEVQNPPPSA